MFPWAFGEREGKEASATVVKKRQDFSHPFRKRITLIQGFSRKVGRLGQYLARLPDGFVRERRNLRANLED